MVAWVKEHPYLSGTLVILLIVLFFVFRRGSRQTTAGVTAGGQYIPSDAVQTAQLAAGVQQQQITAASVAQTNQVNAALAAAQLQSATAVQLAQASRDVELQKIVTSGEVASGQTNAQLQAALASTGAQVQIAGINASAGNYQAGIAGQVAEEQSANALEAQQALYASQVQIAGISADVAKYGISADVTKSLATTAAGVTEAGYARDVSLAGIAADVTKAGYSSEVAMNTNLTAEHIAQIQSTTGINITKLQEQTKQTAITTAGNVETSAITAEEKVAMQHEIDVSRNQADLQRGVFGAVGNLSTGQSRNERAAVLSNFIAPGTGAAIEAPITAQAPGNSAFGWLSGIGNVISSVFGGAAAVGVHP